MATTKLPTRLARLTLYSGPDCSLCDVAKAELAKIRQTRNFELDIVNIQEPGKEHWRKKYVYWIPALHIDGQEVAKGRWDGQTVTRALDVWQKNHLGTLEGSFKKHYPSLSSPPIYDRYTADVLGAEIEDGLSFDEDVSHCFNCGSTQHLVSSCPTPHNVALIALSRQMYNFFKPFRSVEQMTISAAAEFKRQRHEWIDSFEPGHVRGPLLREALGLHDDDVGSDVPWLKNMADWGYPSGWFSKADPREGIIQKIDHLFVEDLDPGEGNHSLVIFGDKEAEILDISALPAHKLSSREGIDKSQDTRESPVIRVDTSKQVELERCRRWAAYPSTYFSSDLLPVYNGTRLPPMLPTTSSTFTSERHLLWERLLNDAASPRIPGPSMRILEMVPNTTALPSSSSSPPPPPIAPPPPLPSLPPPIPAINKKVDDAPPGAHNPYNTSSDGESDMELSDSDT